MATIPVPVLAIQAHYMVGLAQQLSADLVPHLQREFGAKQAQAMPCTAAWQAVEAAWVLLRDARDHLRAAVRETPVASCVLTAADRAEAREASDRG